MCIYEMPSSLVYDPDKSPTINDELVSRINKFNTDLLNGIPLSEMRKRLALEPEEVVMQTIEATTNYVTSVKYKNQEIPTKHFVLRFPFLCEKR